MTARYSPSQVQRARELLTRLAAALRGARFYPVHHPAVQALVADLKRTLDAYFAEGRDVELTFNEGEILLGDTVLTEESVLFDQLQRDLTQIGADSVTIRRGMGVAELSALVGILARDEPTLHESGGLAAAATAAGIIHAEFAAVTVYVPEEPSLDTDPKVAAKATYDGALDVLRDLDASVARGRSLDVAPIRKVANSLVDNAMDNGPAILELSTLKDHDEYTFYHSVNTAILALALGAAVTNDRRFLVSLAVGGLLHDIGKLYVGLDILQKEGTLTAEEWEVMREHPVYSAEAVARLGGIDRSVIVIVYEHHQRLDGSGYPVATPGHRQSLAGRMVAIADSYDAMTSERSYSAARLPDEALGVLASCAGTSFDARLVRLFIRVLGVYPPRCVVRLTSGELAVVSAVDGRDPALPVVRIFAAADGSLAPAPLQIELASPQAAGLAIVGCVDAKASGIDVEDYL